MQRNTGSSGQQRYGFKPKHNSKQSYKNKGKPQYRNKSNLKNFDDVPKDFIGSPKITFEAVSIPKIQQYIKKYPVTTAAKDARKLELLKILKQLNTHREFLVTKIEQIEQRLRFSQSQPLTDDLFQLKKDDNKLICNIIDCLIALK